MGFVALLENLMCVGTRDCVCVCIDIEFVYLELWGLGDQKRRLGSDSIATQMDLANRRSL